ncbi:hypothetical protein Agub_g8132, partial [Astrephomene gubernaculifera]
GSYDELLADPDIDAVYVGLPNGLHGQWSQAALRAGKHVLCEKPFTANEEEAREVQSLARQRGLLCREAFHYREHPLLQHLQHTLTGQQRPQQGKQQQGGGADADVAVGSGGALGPLRSIEVAVLIPSWVFGGANIRWQETLAGGAAMDAGCYCLHAIRSLVGGQPGVEAAEAVLAPHSRLVDASMRGQLRWRGDPARSGVRAAFRASLQHGGLLPVSTIDVTGERGSLHCSNFIMPVFGNVVRMTTTTTATTATTGPDGSITVQQPPRTTTTTTRVYGSGESTYFYQLDRFVRDVRTLQEAADRGDKGSLLSAARSLSEADTADCVANMALLDAVYGAAGLARRLPTGVAAG